MNVARLPCLRKELGVSFAVGDFHLGSWEGRAVLVVCYSVGRLNSLIPHLREIVVAKQMATHHNAHKILGRCLETDTPVLVYEWLPAETLHDRLFVEDENQSKGVLEWKDRLRIAWEISHVVAYLHSAFPRPIIHRGLNPENVFLDQDNVAKLWEFSLSISIPEGKKYVEDERVRGTLGFVDPEYVYSHLVAESTDVYSFGVLFLVLLTGKDASCFKHSIDSFFWQNGLVCWVRNGIKDNIISNIVDPAITRNRLTTIEDLQLRASVHLALCCVIDQGDIRPTMVEVATELKNMIRSPESIIGRGIHLIFHGQEENFVQNEALLLGESISLFCGTTNPIHYFSVVDLNNMHVEHDLISRDAYCNWYQGSWEGRAVLVKLARRLIEGQASIDKIQVRLTRDIVITTQMATHNNVLKLLGCCLETEFPVLVYEWISPKTLEHHIFLKDHTDKEKVPLLEWKDRLRIAWEISQVLSKLHSVFPRHIIYFDLKPHNIFLDQDGAAKISNFSLSFSIPEGQNFVELEGACHQRAPEYGEHGRIPRYTDVYSFGMLFLVLLTGKHDNFHYSSGEGKVEWTKLNNWVTKELKKECISDIVDPRITINGVPTTELSASIELALRCTATEEDSRPTMVEVATELNKIIRFSESIPSSSSGV